MHHLTRTSTVFLLIGLLAATAAAKCSGSNEDKVIEKPQIEVCFVLDTTGSMSGLIQGAKDKIWSIANEMAAAKPAPDIKFGLVGYRDLNDEYITKIIDMTDDLDKVHTELMAFQAGGGGDGPESVNQALLESVEKMNWSEQDRVLKIIFLVGDAPPHMDYQEKQYPEICELALSKHLIINTVQCGAMPATTVVWNEIAKMGEGEFIAIMQNGGMQAIATPFDKEIVTLNGKLNRTLVCYGDQAAQQSFSSKVNNNLASKAEAQADRAGYFSKGRSDGSGREGKIIGGDDDLVEQVMNAEIEYDEIETLDAEQLPAELQKLPPKERRQAVELKVEERKKLQAQMDQLVKQRSDYIAKEKEKLAAAGKENSFDSNVKLMLRKQGASKGINFEDR